MDSKVRFAAVLVGALAALVSWSGLAGAHDRPLPKVSAPGILLIDSGGTVLLERNSQAARAPASLVKMMTLYLALEDLAAGRARWDDRVTVSSRAAAIPPHRLGLREGEGVELHVLLDAVAIASANDAAAAVAEHLADGDEAAFVERMNDKARELGLADTTFANPHGLPHPAQRSTARDLAELTTRLLRDHPEARALLGGQSFAYRGRVHGRRIPLFENPGGVEALKTGFTREAGYNLAVSVTRSQRQLFLILLGAQTRGGSYVDAARAIQYGFLAVGLSNRASKPRIAAQRPAR